MNTLSTRNLSAGTKALMLFAFSIMTGFMWRVRGDHGWGSMWGMFAVGVAMMLFIFAFFGNKKKMTYEAIPIAVFLLGITNGGWGTLNSQMGGYLGSTAAFTGEEVARTIEISPFSGLGIMLLLGFGWMPLFALFLGSLFSKREYKLKNYIMLIAVYYVVMLAMQASLSHYVLPLINPEAVEGFKLGLADRGIDMSPIKAYITNFGSAAWAKKVPFGRNYFTSIEVISSAIASLVSSLAALVVLKDKITAFLSTGINFVCAIAITAADVFLILDSDRGFFASVNAPAFIVNCGWSLWEFFTGFLLGFGIMLLLICLPKSIAGSEGRFEYEPVIENDKLRAAFHALFTFVFVFVLTLARPLGGRISEWIAIRGWSDEEDLIQIIISVVVCVIAFIPSVIVAKKNCVSKGLPIPVTKRCEDFCTLAAPLYFVTTGIIYFGASFNKRTDILLLFRGIKNPSMLLETLKEGGCIITILMIIAFILFFGFWSAATISARKTEKISEK
ncbi:MAG: hypothetical protein J6R20_04650 [Clostridia bacterium]|nr:hypothetical protein [Clostridia bacterium]